MPFRLEWFGAVCELGGRARCTDRDSNGRSATPRNPRSPDHCSSLPRQAAVYPLANSDHPVTPLPR
jgi:hypothetical protein